MKGGAVIAAVLALCSTLVVAGCKSGQSSSSEQNTQVAPRSAAEFTVPPNAPPAPKVDAKRAFQYVNEVVDFGPRPIGSPAHQKLEAYIHDKMKGVAVEDDAFTAQTPRGQFPIRNIIAKFAGKKDGIIVLAGHYDTKMDMPNFVGANDGGSSTGILLEIADLLRGQQQRDGYTVYLVWLDGEEATKNWTATDSVYGSRHLADKWQKDGTAKKIKAFILFDMIGDADLNIERETNSAPWLLDLIGTAAKSLGYQKNFYAREMPIEDDHMPFQHIGVPVADLIDFNYGFDNLYWHTSEDKMDKLSSKSLEIVGNTVMETIRMLDAH